MAWNGRYKPNPGMLTETTFIFLPTFADMFLQLDERAAALFTAGVLAFNVALTPLCGQAADEPVRAPGRGGRLGAGGAGGAPAFTPSSAAASAAAGEAADVAGEAAALSLADAALLDGRKRWNGVALYTSD